VTPEEEREAIQQEGCGMLCATHIADLRASGLSDDTIRAAGLRCGAHDEVRRILGYDVGPGLLFEYPGTNGTAAPFIRVKPDRPFKDASGRTAKYLTAKGATNRLYIPTKYDNRVLGDPAVPIIITEGEKKALKGAQDLDEYVTLALAGVWCFKTKDRVLPD